MQLTVEVLQWVGFGLAPTSLSVDTGGIDIGGTTNGGASSSVVATVSDNSSVDITIEQAGYHSYSVTIDNVYNVDKTIKVLLVEEITDISDPEYLLPHSYFFTFQDPCSYNVDVYSASSYTGEISWYLNNTLLTQQANNSKFTQIFNTVGDYQIKMGTKTTDQNGVAWLRQWASGLETGNTAKGIGVASSDLTSYLNLDTTTNITIVEYIPTISYSLSDATGAVNGTSCYTQNETLTATADITLTRAGADPLQHTITWTVYDPLGAVVSTTTQSLGLTTNEITIVPSTLGTYTIEGVVEDIVCNKTWTKSITFSTCNFLYINTTSNCNEFKIFNASTQYGVSYEVALIDGTVEITDSLVARSGAEPTEGSFTLTTPGIHTVTATWYTDLDDPTTLQTQITVINNWCDIWDCLAGYINEVLCNPEQLCNPCPDSLVLNQMLLFNQTYSMMMNSEYEFNNFYSALDASKLVEYQNMDKLLNKMKKLCSRLSCTSPCLNVTTKDKTFSFGISSGNTSSSSSGGCGCN